MKPRYRLFIPKDGLTIGCREDMRGDGMAEMHIYNSVNKKHVWEIAPFINAMELITGKSGKTYMP